MKSYVEESLGRNETILYRAHFPWFYAAGAWSALAVSALAAAYAAVNSNNLVALALLAVGVSVFVFVLYPVWTTSITVTNQRFIYRRGLLSRTSHDLQLRAVEEVNLQQGIVWRLLDCGRLDLHGTGVDNIQLPLLADPVGLRQALQNGMDSASVKPGAPPMAQQGVETIARSA